MNSQSNREDTPLIDGGDGIPPEAFRVPLPPEALRARLLARTSARVRARPRWRRLILGGALLCAYAGGAGSMALLMSGEAVRGEDVVTVVERLSAESPEGPRLPEALLFDSEALARRVAAAPQEERLALLREAGDRYLNEWGDTVRAVGCYRRLLDSLEADAKPETGVPDTWLLASLKASRQKERPDAN